MILLPVVLGGFYLFWVLLRDFDFYKSRRCVVTRYTEVIWWMLSSRCCSRSVCASLFVVGGGTKHWNRWTLSVREYVSSISYAARPGGSPDRGGEPLPVLAKYDNVSFAKSLGNSDRYRQFGRYVDYSPHHRHHCIAQLPIFVAFLQRTGTKSRFISPPFDFGMVFISFCFLFYWCVILLYYLKRCSSMNG